MRVGLLLPAAAVLLSGCGRYAEFVLPPPPAGPETHFRPWIQYDPVLTRGAAGEWDSVDALNPSVLRWNNRYLNLYSGFDGKTWHTGVATSDDGLSWIKQGKVLSPSGWEGNYIAANGSAATLNGEILYWYQAGSPPRMALATSKDARAFTKRDHPVLDLGPRGSWDELGVGDPYVIRAGDQWYVYYLGMDRAHRQRLGVARSSDGVQWTKLRANPILEIGEPGAFDEIGLGEPAVWPMNGYYWMLYTGRDRAEVRRIGLARSRDGVRWERSDRVPVFSGSESWNNKVVADPTVEVTPEGIKVWYGGGNVARPDERLNGQIGFALLKPY